ncbi:hypothetical protein BH10PSE3_BH10PSE3_30870 [soil metagenome]
MSTCRQTRSTACWGSTIRDDHGEALLRIEAGVPGETYLIGGEAEESNLDLVHAICGALDRLAPANAPRAELITHVADRPAHDRRYAIGAGKLSNAQGWRPRTSLETGLEQTVRWYLDNETWWRALRERGFSGQRLGTEL